MIHGRIELYSSLMDTIGEEGCSVACNPNDIFQNHEGWQLFIEGFMQPWFLGKTIPEAKVRIREYATRRFGSP